MYCHNLLALITLDRCSPRRFLIVHAVLGKQTDRSAPWTLTRWTALHSNGSATRAPPDHQSQESWMQRPSMIQQRGERTGDEGMGVLGDAPFELNSVLSPSLPVD